MLRCCPEAQRTHKHPQEVWATKRYMAIPSFRLLGLTWNATWPISISTTICIPRDLMEAGPLSLGSIVSAGLDVLLEPIEEVFWRDRGGQDGHWASSTKRKTQPSSNVANIC